MKELDGNTDSMDLSLSKLWETVKDREAWHAAAHQVEKSRTDLATEQQHESCTCVCFGKSVIPGNDVLPSSNIASSLVAIFEEEFCWIWNSRKEMAIHSSNLAWRIL